MIYSASNIEGRRMKLFKKFIKGKEKSSSSKPLSNKPPINRTGRPAKLLTAHEIAEKLSTDRRKLERIFIELGWTEKCAKGTKATQAGIANGAQIKYHDMSKNNYVVWDENIVNNQTLKESL